MFRARFLCLIMALFMVLSLGSIAMAAQVDCDTTFLPHSR